MTGLIRLIVVIIFAFSVISVNAQIPVTFKGGKFLIDGKEKYTETFNSNFSNKFPIHKFPVYNGYKSTWQNGSYNSTSTIPNWYLGMDGVYVKSFTFYGNDGTYTEAAPYAYGADWSPDRAVGGRGKPMSAVFYAAVKLKNNSNKIIEKFEIKSNIEQWYLDDVESEIILQYAIGANVNSATTTSVKWITIKSEKTDKANIGKTDGNSKIKSLDGVADKVYLAPGKEIVFRWILELSKNDTKFNGLALDDVVISAAGEGKKADLHDRDQDPPQPIVFYNKVDEDLDDTESWGTNSDGSGTEPRNFSDPNQTFIVKNFKKTGKSWLSKWLKYRDVIETLKIDSEEEGWIVSGAGSKVIIGDGINEVKVAIKNESFIVATVDVAAKATLLINSSKSKNESKYSTIVPTFGTLDPNSTIIYSDSTDLDLNLNVTYGNIVFLGNSYSKTKGLDVQNLSVPLTIKGSLELSGKKLNLKGNSLTIEATGNTDNADNDSYVVAEGTGKLIRKLPAGATNDYSFPVGTATEYAPVKIKGSTSALEYRVGIKTGVANATKSKNATYRAIADKTWIIEKEVLASGNTTATYTLSWNDPQDSLSTAKLSEMYVGLYNQATGKWDIKSVSGFKKDSATGLYQITFQDNFDAGAVIGTNGASQNNTTFSATYSTNAVAQPLGTTAEYASYQYTAFRGKSSGASPLPVELLSFTARPIDNMVELNWKTASETDNDYFAVKYSLDGVNFEEVGRVKGMGNSSVSQNYSFKHRPMQDGVVYYHLAQTDYSGKVTYSKTIHLTFKKESVSAISAYPNPVINTVTLSQPADEITVRNMQGVVINRMVSTQSIDFANYTKGVYIVEVKINDEYKQLKIVKR